MIPVTLWYLELKEKVSFNHLEYGHATTDTPIPISDEQVKNWKNSQWIRKYSYGTTDIPMVVSDV
jgi:hypothetical protein